VSARDPFPAGTRVLWDGDEFIVWDAHPKKGYRWIIREGSERPIAASVKNLTIIGHAATPSVQNMPVAPARSTDPATSHAAAKAVTVRAGNQRHTLLGAYRDDAVLTDAEAAHRVGLLGTRSCWWKRCSELREGGFIEVVGVATDPQTGSQAQTCRITHAGRAAL
jgi:hypothetical protein